MQENNASISEFSRTANLKKMAKTENNQKILHIPSSQLFSRRLTCAG